MCSCGERVQASECCRCTTPTTIFRSCRMRARRSPSKRRRRILRERRRLFLSLESITMSGRWIDRVVVVLVRARNPNNIGAVARAMHDFGFQHLRVVNEYGVPFESARSAVDASEVLAGAEAFGSVADAVADCKLVVGTTAVGERVL